VDDATRAYLELRIDYEQRLVTARLDAQDRALTLQAAEYERRLEVLNHAHAAAVKESARVLPRETFDTKWAELDRRVGDVEKSLAASGAQAATLTAIIATVISILSTLLVSWVVR
jgi:hypothetical protein